MKILQDLDDLVGQVVIYSKEYYNGIIIATENRSVLVLETDNNYDDYEIKVKKPIAIKLEFLTSLAKYPDRPAADHIKDLVDLEVITSEDIEERREEIKKENERTMKRLLDQEREQYEKLKKKFEGE